MSNAKRVWSYLIAEPFWWIFLCFFQPTQFSTEIEKAGWSKLRQRIIAVGQLVIPLFCIIYPFALLIRIVLTLFHFLLSTNTQTFLLTTLFGVTIGLAIGLATGVTLIIALDISFSITFGIVLGIIFGVAINLASSTIIIGITSGAILGIFLGVTSGGSFFVFTNIILGLSLGILFSITFGFGSDISFNIAIDITFGIFFTANYYRSSFYLLDIFSTLIAYFASLRKPSRVITYLRHSSLHWDERVYLPLPFLKRTLVLAVEEDEQQAVEEIIFIVNERPLQSRAARAAVAEIIVRDLETRKSMVEIGEAWPYLSALLPLEARPSEPRWGRLIQYFSAISVDAERYGMPIGQQEKQKALLAINENLRKASQTVAFRDAKLNVRLLRVIETWQATVQQEQERLKHTPQEVGKPDNPYKPGQALKPHDELFVGRRDLAELLSKELNRGSRRPTFLMNGERRMGKTTTLLQLPYLLGSHYIPVFYNLQNPGLYKSIATFLSALGDRIYTELHAKGIEVEPISSRVLRDPYGQSQEASAYDAFDRWLGRVEAVLERDEYTLLLNFDEFEKLAEAGNYINLTLLLDWFRNIIQFHPCIALLFSGVHTFSEMGQETGVNWSGSFVNVQTLKVGFLQRDEAEKLIRKPRPDYPSEELFGKGVVERIIDDTGCHPFLVQAVCSGLIDNLNAEQRQRAKLADVEKATEQVLEGWDGYFGDLWVRTPQEQRTCLETLLTLQCADKVRIQQHSNMSEKVVRHTLKALLQRDLIAYNEQDETYIIVAPIFRAWVERYV